MYTLCKQWWTQLHNSFLVKLKKLSEVNISAYLCSQSVDWASSVTDFDCICLKLSSNRKTSNILLEVSKGSLSSSRLVVQLPSEEYVLRYYRKYASSLLAASGSHGFWVFSQFSVFVSPFYSSPFCDLNCFRPQTSFHSTQSSHVQLPLLLPCLFNSIYAPTHLHPSFSFLLHIYSSCCPCSLLQTNTSVCSHPSFSIFFPPLLLCCPIPPVLHGFHIFKVK